MSKFDFIDDARFPSYYKICKNTKLLKYKKSLQREYSDSYFNEEYQSQYKKTYYEDEQNLRNLAKKRLDILQEFLPSFSDLTLLEIGCACGFFLDEAKKKGLNTFGLEISKSEVSYAKKIGLNVIQNSFLEHHFQQKFNIICAFFVLEHIENLSLLFDKLKKMIKKNGFLFVALPSIYGPSFQTNIENWFKSHPSDHFFDYSPMSLQKVLKLYSFEIVYKKPMSYHQQRDKGWKGKFLTKSLYEKYANFFCYGDTMQILAQKTDS